MVPLLIAKVTVEEGLKYGAWLLGGATIVTGGYLIGDYHRGNADRAFVEERFPGFGHLMLPKGHRNIVINKESAIRTEIKKWQKYEKYLPIPRDYHELIMREILVYGVTEAAAIKTLAKENINADTEIVYDSRWETADQKKLRTIMRGLKPGQKPSYNDCFEACDNKDAAEFFSGESAPDKNDEPETLQAVDGGQISLSDHNTALMAQSTLLKNMKGEKDTAVKEMNSVKTHSDYTTELLWKQYKKDQSILNAASAKKLGFPARLEEENDNTE